jgi:hypothetical protein
VFLPSEKLPPINHVTPAIKIYTHTILVASLRNVLVPVTSTNIYAPTNNNITPNAPKVNLDLLIRDHQMVA